MIDDQALKEWFCREVLPLERALSAFIRRNWRDAADVVDLRQDIYERVLLEARHGLAAQAGQFVYTVARNHLINRAKRARIVSFDVVADLDAISGNDVPDPERQLLAREELRRIQVGLEQLPPRCREVVLLRKIRGLSARETANELGIGVDTVEKQMTLGHLKLSIPMLLNLGMSGFGRFQPWWHQVAVRVHHWKGGAQAFLDGKRIADPVTGEGVLHVTMDDPSGESRLSLKTSFGR